MSDFNVLVTHPNVGGEVKITEEQFEKLYKGKGWKRVEDKKEDKGDNGDNGEDGGESRGEMKKTGAKDNKDK